MKTGNHLKSSELNILSSFVKAFLPPTGSKRKYPSNEIQYLSTTLDKIFIQRFKINISHDVALDLFRSLPDYSIFEVNGKWYDGEEIIKPSKSGSPNYFIYIDVPPTIVRLLRKTTAKLTANTNPSKRTKVDELIRRIEEFKSQL